MLKFLRKKENLKRIMWALALLIIPAFVLWGSGSAIRSRDLPKYAGNIFGRRISFSQYEKSLLACRNYALLIYGDNFNRIAQFLDLEEAAWERLILNYQAKKENIEISDEEVVEFVRKIPLFQTEGRFNQDRYNTLLQYAFRVSPREFEEQLREVLKINKLKDRVTSHLKLADEEIDKEYKKENEEAEALYIFIDPEKFKEQIHPAYEELQDYFQAHKAEFTKPEQVNVQYIALDLEPALAQMQVSEEEIKNYYQENLQEFSVKGENEKQTTKTLKEVAGLIEKRLKQQKAKLDLEEKAWQISDAIGDDAQSLEEIAKQNQLEAKETGFFGPQEMIPEVGLSYEFLQAAFTLKLGQISNIIETPRGYFIIKVKEKKEPYIPDLEEVKAEVEAAVVKQQSLQLAKEKGKGIVSQLKNIIEEKKIDFPKAAEKLSLTIKETERFSKSSYIPGIGQSEEFTQAAFALNPGEVSDIIKVPNGYCILSLKAIFPIDEERFMQEKKDFTQKLLARKKDNFYKVWLKDLKKTAKLVSNIERLKRKQAP